MKAFRILAAAVALLSFGQVACAAPPLKITLGWVVAPGSVASLLTMKPGLAVHRGISYTLEPIHFRSTAVELVALASGQLDIADQSYSSIASAIENAHLADLRVFADEIEDGIDGHENGSGFLVLKNGPIKTFADLKGRVVAVLTIGSATDMQARIMLRRHGLQPDRDYSIIEAPFANMKSILFQGKAAMVAIAPPFAYDPELRAKSRMLFSETDVMGPTQLLALVARKRFLDKNHAVLVDFMEDEIRTVRWFIDPKNHAAAIRLAAALSKRPAAQLERLFTKEDNYRDPNAMPNLAALQHSLDLEYKAGIAKTRIDIRHYADLSIVREAAARLK